MNKFPPEVLHRIFINLGLKQRLVCLLVCHKWWRVLVRYSLFYTIEIEQDAQIHRMMQVFEKSPVLAAQVQEVYITMTSHSLFNRRTLFNVFPNARKISVKRNASYYGSYTLPFPTPIAITHSKSNLEILYDFITFELVSQVIHSNLGSRLVTLYLSFQQTAPELPIPELKNLPVLKHLSLLVPRIKPADLEKIHENVPSIQKLALDSMYMSEGEMPSNIVPATLIKTLILHNMRFMEVENHILFYQYMTKKYTNLTHVDYQDKWLICQDADENRDIYLNGIFGFLKLIGPIKSELSLCVLPDGINPFKVLDSAGSQIKKFHFWNCDSGTLFRYLSHSTQSKWIEKLELQNTRIDTIHYIKHMTALTVLTITFESVESPPVHLVDCLNSCPPTLKTLNVLSPNVIAEPSKNQLYSIEALCIRCNTMTSVLGDMISTCFPNLIYLALTGEIKEDVNITMANPHFMSAKFSRNVINGTQGFSFTSPNQVKMMYHIRDEKVKHVQDHPIPNLSFVSFVKTKLELEKSVINILPS